MVRVVVWLNLGLLLVPCPGPANQAQAQPPAGAIRSDKGPVEIVLVEADTVTPGSVERWKAEGFKGVAVLLDERGTEAAHRQVARHISEASLDLYWWIEVARNKTMAEAHPRWMATLGMHDDWQRNFTNLAEPQVTQVAKAFPWVPIGYRETFEAHLVRIDQLLRRIPTNWGGLLLNDLQGGPSSCGCGNLQCRWALDYGMRSTATKLPSDAVAASFVAEVRKRVGQKIVVPVWTTECTQIDLPPEKNQGRPSTHLCGSVACATSTCPEAFRRQWSALSSTHPGPLAVLALHSAFHRTDPTLEGGPNWVTNAVQYVRSAQGTNAKDASPLWVVVEGGTAEEPAARRAAAQTAVETVIVARIKIDPTYEPRLISK